MKSSGNNSEVRTSLIATTYNQSADLDLYLRSLAHQTVEPTEIIIADDGSGADTRAVIDRHRELVWGDRLKHVWHEDEGYRKCKILNKAIRESKGDWLIFTDSDLVLHPRFVEDHSQVASKNSLFMGRRVDLGPRVSEWIRQNREKIFTLPFYTRVLASSFGRQSTRNVQRAFRLRKLGKLLGSTHVPDLLGSNFSIDRELLFHINGFDESSEHYWGEDGDLFVRSRNAGAKIHGHKNYAVQLHLWHRMRSPQPDAWAAYQRRLTMTDYVACQNGLRSCDTNT